MESQTFNIKRFGRLFSTELKGGIQKNWVSMLIMVLIEVTAVLTVGVMSMMLENGWNSGGIATRAISFFAFLAVTLIVLPSKLYGHVYDRLSGPAYLMLPASRLEKFLSMILNSVIIIPFSLIALFLGIDALICAIDPTAGVGIYSQIRIPSSLFLTGVIEDGTALSPLMFADDLIAMILFFLLGALMFKTHKSAKTLLAMIILMQALSLLAVAVFAIFFNATDIGETIMSSPFLAHIGDHAVLYDTLNDTVTNVILLVCIWFRLKTLKI